MKGKGMKRIEEGILKKHPPGQKDGFIDAIYELFREFRDVYWRAEWPRLDSCERMYRGEHWHDVYSDENEPRPVTPILFSTIENLKADLTDEFPEAVIKPEETGDEVVAKVLTKLVAQSLEAMDYEEEYDKLTHDLLVGGWMVQEAGWDPTLHNGIGGAFLRHVSNKNILFDPYCASLQKGRAVFKFDRLPKEWFRQHYPNVYGHMKDDSDLIDQHHADFDSTVAPLEDDFFVLLEAWFRFYDPITRKSRVHMVVLSGGCVLENSALVKSEGYFTHGMYPFVVTPLYEQKGSPLGLGVVDMFKSAQQYSDKIDQIILKNALCAGHNRFLVMEGACDVDDLKDYEKEVISTTAPPNSTMQWVQDRPLPSHIIAYMQQMRESIKEESGSNDFSRGGVRAGVTAASAITALQEMSSKRSRLEARRIHYGFKQGVRMMLEIIREFDITPRRVIITLGGENVPVLVKNAMQNGEMPLEFSVSIKPVRQSRFAKLSNNQMILEFCAMFKGQIDPTVLMEAMDFDGQELILEKLRTARPNEEGAKAKQGGTQDINRASEAARAVQGAQAAIQRPSMGMQR